MRGEGRREGGRGAETKEDASGDPGVRGESGSRRQPRTGRKRTGGQPHKRHRRGRGMGVRVGRGGRGAGRQRQRRQVLGRGGGGEKVRGGGGAGRLPYRAHPEEVRGVTPTPTRRAAGGGLGPARRTPFGAAVCGGAGARVSPSVLLRPRPGSVQGVRVPGARAGGGPEGSDPRAEVEGQAHPHRRSDGHTSNHPCTPHLPSDRGTCK